MANLIRVTVGGTMPSGEKWSINPCWGFEAPGIPIDDVKANAIAQACLTTAIPATTRGYNVPGVGLGDFRVEARNWAGDLEAVGEASGTPTVGTASTNVQPYQSALVLSLRTLHSGQTGKGRLYWPMTAVALSSTTLRMSASDQSIFLPAIKTYLGSLQSSIRTASGSATAGLIVWSRKNAAGYYVTKIAIGDVLDTQRRRRDTLVENYTETTFP